ncbi:DsbA family protein [Aerococcaceae bacterium zg-ZJ1578]|uniref:DsbA family protein n=2 Tax=Aerococcaceae TaxID=186827 RepID=UPI0013D43872|nr:DsbA family protein [Facklamia sp. 252]MBK0347612.1 DsbA family protein [Aerococcaceae bacterium zg-1578]MBS4461593.1 DsbA family protein [Aerococcaceae bacterium zg-B36]QQD65233.1 DsbA family protein [Aerococcaceae bacterium zg-252]
MESNYQVEYMTNGVPKVFEFYLFVNPLGQKCYVCECELQKTLTKISTNVDIHVICFHNQQIVSDFMKQLNIPSSDLTSRNYIYQSVYLASLAYKAATMQGKKKGRRFLMRMQEEIDGYLERFSDQFILDLAEEVGLDMMTFKEDLESDYARDLVFQDLQIAKEMAVEGTPTLVMFEHRLGEKGLLLKENITASNIISHLDELVRYDFINQSNKPNLVLLQNK